jgi:hypothetical protein
MFSMKNHALPLLALLTFVPACWSAAINVSVAAANTNANLNGNAAVIVQPTPQPARGDTQPAAPEAVIADLYKVHNHKNDKNDPFFNSKNRAAVDKYFVKDLADLIWNDAVTSQKNNEVGVIDGDPLYNAQDTDIKNFAVGHPDVKGDTATVPVTFTNFGKKETINFKLVVSGNAWKIDDIVYGGEAGSLRQWFKDSSH